jgi:histidinol-phosphate aminotransferase
MSVSRRSFVRTLGLGTTALSTSFVTGRAGDAAAFGGATAAAEPSEIIRLSNNENNRGPGAKALEAVHASIGPGNGRGYPPDHVNELTDAIAAKWSVNRTNVIVGTGSGPILEGSVRAFCAADKGLVMASPTYGTPENMAKRLGFPVKSIPVDRNMQVDLNAMADAAKGAGLVFLVNPNNPTGAARTGAEIEQFVRRIKRESPSTAILLDEAYIDYAHDPAITTAKPLAMELPGVFITRSFSKAHGMAGMRLGYAIGQEATVQAIPKVWQLGSVNTFTAAAGIASLKDTQHIADEVAENARVREFTIKSFRDMGYTVVDSHANCIFVDVKSSAPAFRDACLAQKIQVGRDFPPYEKTHTRITLGTMDQMRQAVTVFRSVLSKKATAQ